MKKKLKRKNNLVWSFGGSVGRSLSFTYFKEKLCKFIEFSMIFVCPTAIYKKMSRKKLTKINLNLKKLKKKLVLFGIEESYRQISLRERDLGLLPTLSHKVIMK